jgi:hypothetical protein
MSLLCYFDEPSHFTAVKVNEVAWSDRHPEILKNVGWVGKWFVAFYNMSFINVYFTVDETTFTVLIKEYCGMSAESRNSLTRRDIRC